MHALGADSAEVSASLARLELERSDGAARSGERGGDVLDAVTAGVRADRRDAVLDGNAQQQDGQTAYDSAVRRERTADGMLAADVPEETIAVAMRADTAHERPALNVVVRLAG